MTPKDYDDWVKEVKETAVPLTEDEFKSLLKTEHVGRKSYSSTHLSFSPAPADHSEMDMDMDHDNMDGMDMDNGSMEHQDNKEIHPSPEPSSQTEFDSVPNPELDEPAPSSPAQ